MAFNPKSVHISQLQFNPNTGGLDGRDDCGPAALVRYLREMGILPISGSIEDQIHMIRTLITGLPDQPGQPGTSDTDLERVLAHFGLQANWTTSFVELLAAQISILLISHGPIPAQYPQSWLGGQNHWILWLPNWKGSADWYNDPLAYANGQMDCEYTQASVQEALIGGIVLQPIPGLMVTEVLGQVTQRCGLKVQANASCSSLCIIPAPPLGKFKFMGKESTDPVSKVVYTYIQFKDKFGWVPIKKTRRL